MQPYFDMGKNAMGTSYEDLPEKPNEKDLMDKDSDEWNYGELPEWLENAPYYLMGGLFGGTLAGMHNVKSGRTALEELGETLSHIPDWLGLPPPPPPAPSSMPDSKDEQIEQGKDEVDKKDNEEKSNQVDENTIMDWINQGFDINWIVQKLSELGAFGLIGKAWDIWNKLNNSDDPSKPKENSEYKPEDFFNPSNWFGDMGDNKENAGNEFSFDPEKALFGGLAGAPFGLAGLLGGFINGINNIGNIVNNWLQSLFGFTEEMGKNVANILRIAIPILIIILIVVFAIKILGRLL